MQNVVPLDERQQEQRLQKLEALGLTLSQKRQAAITHRSNSGIETIWLEDEEFYMGIDDANRDEFGVTVEKPTTSGSRVFSRGSNNQASEVKSTVFPNITQPYVDAAAARIGDMLLPTDDRNFALESSPIPDLLDIEALLGDTPDAPVAAPPGGMPAAPPAGMPAVAPTPPVPPAMVPLPDGSMVPEQQLRDEIAKTKATSRRRTEKAQTRIDDWLDESRYLSEVRQVLDDCAKVGTGILKGPFPKRRNRKTWTKTEEGDIALVMIEDIKPSSARISYWNLYPDPACGESIHNGAWIWEMDTLTEKGLKALKGLPGYLDDQIDLCIEEGPIKYTAAGAVPWGDKEHKGKFQIWYYHGEVSREDIEATGCKCAHDARSFDVLITMVNNHVVRAALNPLDSGEFPYDVMRWKRRPGHWAGVGVSRQMRTSQRMVVAATRNMMDNAGLGAGPMLVVGRGIIPQNNIWEIKPRKIWIRDQESDDRPVEQDFKVAIIPMLVQELQQIIQLGMKMAEDSTGLPMLLQGQQGAAPDTVGGMQMLNNNASAVLRRIARHFDNDLTIPHIQRYYDWLMMYGTDPEEKGDLYVVARGSSALVERDAQTMELAQIVSMTLNPAFGKNPSKAMDEYLKSRRFDPEAFDYTPEEKAKMAAQQPPPPPQVAVAQIRAEVDKAKIASNEKLTAQELQVKMEDIENDTDRDMIYVEAETERSRSEHAARMRELEVKRELAMLDYANKNNQNLQSIKADLTTTALKLRTQKELAAASNAVAQVATPAVEPPGRAPDGQAFQK